MYVRVLMLKWIYRHSNLHSCMARYQLREGIAKGFESGCYVGAYTGAYRDKRQAQHIHGKSEAVEQVFQS